MRRRNSSETRSENKKSAKTANGERKKPDGRGGDEV
jgi:hypothetical protein